MKPTKETSVLLKLLSVYDDWRHVGNELASTANSQQAENFNSLVIGWDEIRRIHGY